MVAGDVDQDTHQGGLTGEDTPDQDIMPSEPNPDERTDPVEAQSSFSCGLLTDTQFSEPDQPA